MANITITIPDAKLNAIVEAFATQYNYQDQITEDGMNYIPNPVSKAQFARNVINSFIKEVYVAAQVKELDATRVQTINTATAAVSDITVS